ncbi:Ger(x)C family germination protein [Paenibacillus shirakamiensis]|uniref:Ger(X)C family germination protein n=1 Tax=Paenibacillus shirakamiensis TaxID=1265935 RepID=A0ABS4JF10_9BACL|nr:Ger(x)C family spore germination protein [Paenibacillus shirakamiensis]MBP2000307.1 Ger(x)C family germination protein [Paenibacillus shirakamiensis]
MNRLKKTWRIVILMITLTAFPLLSGCWDSINLQDQGYITALGIDYQQGKYKMYAQMASFGSVAKTQSPTSEEDTTWIGTGEGSTVIMAYSELMRTAQFTISLDHLKALVIHERALPKVNDILDGVNRQRASRYTSYVFGTNTELEKILNTSTFFQRSPLLSVIYLPDLQFRQNSFFRPLSMQLFVQALDEPGFTALLPSLTVEDKSWKNSTKNLVVQKFDGIYLFSGRKLQTYMNYDEAQGFRWIDPKFEQYIMVVQGSNKTKVTVAITKSQAKYKLLSGGDHPRYELVMNLKGHTVEVDGLTNAAAIEREMENKIRQEMMRTYKAGCDKKTDIFLMNEQLYRFHNKLWKKLKKEKWVPNEDSLDLKVHFQLIHTGKFQLNSVNHETNATE